MSKKQGKNRQPEKIIHDSELTAIENENDPLSIYLKQISYYSLLSQEEEQEIGARILELKEIIAAAEDMKP